MKTLFIILARGGSKGLPKKNILELLGRPLIGYSIECGLNSKFCTDLIVSTDNEEILSIAKSLGAQTPFLRPKSLSNDTAKSADAIIHAINYQKERGKEYDLIVLLEPTSPLRDTLDVDRAIEKLLKIPRAESCVSVALNESAHPDFLFTKDENQFLKSYTKNEKIVRRQDLNQFYYPEGSFYISKTESFMRHQTFYQENNTLGIIMPKWKSFEIDTMEDFLIVESIMHIKHKFSKNEKI